MRDTITGTKIVPALQATGGSQCKPFEGRFRIAVNGRELTPPA